MTRRDWTSVLSALTRASGAMFRWALAVVATLGCMGLVVAAVWFALLLL